MEGVGAFNFLGVSEPHGLSRVESEFESVLGLSGDDQRLICTFRFEALCWYYAGEAVLVARRRPLRLLLIRARLTMRRTPRRVDRAERTLAVVMVSALSLALSYALAVWIPFCSGSLLNSMSRPNTHFTLVGPMHGCIESVCNSFAFFSLPVCRRRLALSSIWLLSLCPSQFPRHPADQPLFTHNFRKWSVVISTSSFYSVVLGVYTREIHFMCSATYISLGSCYRPWPICLRLTGHPPPDLPLICSGAWIIIFGYSSSVIVQ